MGRGLLFMSVFLGGVDSEGTTEYGMFIYIYSVLFIRY